MNKSIEELALERQQEIREAITKLKEIALHEVKDTDGESDGQNTLGSRLKAFDDLRRLFSAHVKALEGTLYFRTQAQEGASAFDTAVKKHQNFKESIDALEKTALLDENWSAKALTLCETLEKHIQSELGLTPLLSEKFSEAQLIDMGNEYQDIFNAELEHLLPISQVTAEDTMGGITPGAQPRPNEERDYPSAEKRSA